MKTSATVDKLMGIIKKAIDYTVLVFFLIIFVVVLAQILMRWIFHNPLTWSEELCRLMFVWLCFLGWAIATREGSHIKITAVVKKLSLKGQRIMQTCNIGLTIIFSILMIYYGIKMTAISNSGWAVAIPIRFSLVYVICPVSNFFVVNYNLLNLIKVWDPENTEVLA